MTEAMTDDIKSQLDRIEAMLAGIPDVEIVEILTRIESKLSVLIDSLAGDDEAPDEIIDLDGISHTVDYVESGSLDD